MKLNKNDTAYQILTQKAAIQNITLKDYIADKINEDIVCDVMYPQLPKTMRMFMSREKFKAFFVKNKLIFIQNIPE